MKSRHVRQCLRDRSSAYITYVLPEDTCSRCSVLEAPKALVWVYRCCITTRTRRPKRRQSKNYNLSFDINAATESGARSGEIRLVMFIAAGLDSDSSLCLRLFDICCLACVSHLGKARRTVTSGIDPPPIIQGVHPLTIRESQAQEMAAIRNYQSTIHYQVIWVIAVVPERPRGALWSSPDTHGIICELGTIWFILHIF